MEGKVTVILVLFTGYKKNPTSKPGKNSASEEDHLPLQVLQSH
jgi:transient receptor potential cation channel subfamily V protein 2